MTQVKPSRFLTLCVALLIAIPAVVHADRVGKLVRILTTSDSYKVRLQVAITLGKLKDKRAVPALLAALSDDNYTVRGVVATALAQIGDKRAVPKLQRLAQSDSNAFVRKQARRAAKQLLQEGPTGPPRGARFFVTVGKLTNKAKRGGRQLADVLKQALLKEFGKVQGVATPWKARNPSKRELRKLRLKGFVLDGSILSLTTKNTGSGIEVSCSIRVSLATYPGNSMKAFYSGGASMMVSRIVPEYEQKLYQEIVEGAAQGAKEHIARSYLSRQ